MTWVPLEDDFPNHPKAAKAGDLASWLYVSGLCYAGRHLTDGKIPKAQVPRLTSLPRPAQLARKLVDVGLWEDPGGDEFLIHDYGQWNKPAEDVKRKREQDRERKARWRKSGHSTGRDADSPPDDEGTASGTALGIPRSPTPPQSLEPSSISTSDSRPPPTTSGEEEEAKSQNGRSPRVCEAAFAWLARYDRERVEASGSQTIRNVDAWMAAATDNRRTRHAADATRLSAQHPEWDHEQLAKAIAAIDPHAANGEATVAAARVLAARNDLPPCPACDSTGWVDTTEGMTPCHVCERVHA